MEPEVCVLSCNLIRKNTECQRVTAVTYESEARRLSHDGTVPDSVLVPTSKYCRFVMLLIARGRLPVSVLSCRSRRLPRDQGQVRTHWHVEHSTGSYSTGKHIVLLPVTLQLESSSESGTYASAVSTVRVAETDPVSALSLRSISLHRHRTPARPTNRTIDACHWQCHTIQ